MRVTANRKIMLEHLKTMSKLVPTSSVIPELKGFLVETGEDDGYLYVSATNMEAAIQRKFKASIEENGSFVLEAKMLIAILSKLSGEDVLFEMENEGVIKIRSESCEYIMRALQTDRFPRPQIPFPNTTLPIAGIKGLYSKTFDVVHKDVENVLNGIHLKISPNEIEAIGCDGKCIAAAKHLMSCGGSMKMTLSKAALSYLVSAAGDEELEVGIHGNYAVFMKEGLLFMAKQLAKEYVNTEAIFSGIGSVYEAKILSLAEFQNCIRGAKNVAALGKETSAIRLDFEDESITVSTKNNVGDMSFTAEAVMYNGTAGHTFHYTATYLENAFRTIGDTMIVKVDKNGYLCMYNKYNRYLIAPLSKTEVAKQTAKFETQRKIDLGETEVATGKKTRASKKAA